MPVGGRWCERLTIAQHHRPRKGVMTGFGLFVVRRGAALRSVFVFSILFCFSGTRQ